MSAKLMPQTTIKDWLQSASDKLATLNVQTNRLDAEIILASTLDVGRTFLHAHPEQTLDKKQHKIANHKLRLRLKRIPIAYITGSKEFYGRMFKVTRDTLIPRPESETIITLLKSLLKPTDTLSLVDIGTGSGCLGITAKLELPNLKVTLIDISTKAIKIAKINAKALSTEVSIVRNNLLDKYKKKPDVIIANLPYVDKTWPTSPETIHEPSVALFADDHGEALIKKLIKQSINLINKDGYIIIESDPSQHNSLIEYATSNGFNLQEKIGYILAFKLN